jgi:anti-sigma B factor antagonist
MNLNTKSNGKVDIVCLPERLTMANSAAARHAIRDLVDVRHALLVLDMGKLEFVDSSGLSVLVSAVKAARRAGGDVVLCELRPQVQALVELTRLHELFEIFVDEQAATAHLDARAAA